MEEGKIVYRGQSKKGTPFVIRYLSKDDFDQTREYINALSDERTFVIFQGEHVTKEEEDKYLEGQLKQIKNHKSVQLLVIIDDKVMGVSSIDLQNRATSHVGAFGISLAKDYRGEGIGKIFMQTVLSEAEKNLPELRIIILGVFGNNSLAIKLYKSFGFIENGTLPEGIHFRDEYVDHLHMYKKVK